MDALGEQNKAGEDEMAIQIGSKNKRNLYESGQNTENNKAEPKKEEKGFLSQLVQYDEENNDDYTTDLKLNSLKRIRHPILKRFGLTD